MTVLRYVGSHRDGVVIDVLGVTVDWGATVDVPDGVAASLLEQPESWQPVKAATNKTEEV